jgi:hypothetical protein
MTESPPVMKLGNVEITTPQTQARRFTALIWGSSGCGKTTLAATAPGKKLWISFDHGGTDAIAYRDDIEVLDYATEPNKCVELFKEDDPLRLTAFLLQRDDIETIVFDSLTTFGDKALFHGVHKATQTQKGRSATIEDPGYSGYGNKNTWTRLCVKNLLKCTGQANKHMIFIAHEDKPLMNSQGEILSISIMLGSALNEQIPIDFNEIWNLSDTGKERRIAVRNCRFRKPVKSRMFITSGKPEFSWNYNADYDTGEGIVDWYKEWVKNEGKKINLPTS